MPLNAIIFKPYLEVEDIAKILSVDEPKDLEIIRKFAHETLIKHVGAGVYLRGLIEFSNYCINDCLYCGIRKSNSQTERYTLSKDEILDAVAIAQKLNYGSIVLQSGDRRDDDFIDFVVDVLESIKQKTRNSEYPEGMGITLSIGEQSYKNYKRLFDAGAHRYLLRIETTNPILFSEIHPEEQTFENRLDALKALRDVGFQVGTGVLIGLPGQTIDDLARDIDFFRQIDIDMIGMGPYIPHHDTPLGGLFNHSASQKFDPYEMTLKMIAVARIVLKDINMASTTALQTIHPRGREEGLRFGANVLMPQITPVAFRKNYMLYEGKPTITEYSAENNAEMQKRVELLDRTISYGEWGDPLHFFNR